MLDAKEKAAFLERGIFEGLDDDTRLAVAGRMGQRDLQDGEVLFLEGEPGEEIFIILNGEIEIHLADYTVAVLQQGHVFGEMAVFGGGHRTASAKARGETRLLFLKDQAVRLLIQDDPHLAFEFFKVLSDRLEEANRVAQFLAKEKIEYGTIEVISGELAGRTFPLNHSNAFLGRSCGGVADVLRIALPVTGEGLLDKHARVTVSGSSVFIEPRDGEVVVNGEPTDESVEVGPDDTVEVGDLTLHLRAKQP